MQLKLKWIVAILSLTLISASLFFSNYQKERLLVRKIRKIPQEDRAALEAFFRILILQEGGAYVLFGTKPMAFTAYLHTCQPNITTHRMWRYYTENRIIENGWKVWKKHQSEFPSKHFILDYKPFDNRRSEICLIDILKFKKITKTDLSDLFISLGTSPSSLLKTYQQQNIALFKLLNGNHTALGILLGFGKKNAKQFHERALQIGDDPNAIQRIPFKIALQPENLIDSMFLKSAFKETNLNACYKFLYLPCFLVDTHSEETQELKSQYLKQRQLIHEKYAHDNFLETTLKQFCLN